MISGSIERTGVPKTLYTAQIFYEVQAVGDFSWKFVVLKNFKAILKVCVMRSFLILPLLVICFYAVHKCKSSQLEKEEFLLIYLLW